MLKWYRRPGHGYGYWYLKRRGDKRRMAEVFQTPRGWWVVIMATSAFAGPYGDLDVARQAATKRVEAIHDYDD